MESRSQTDVIDNLSFPKDSQELIVLSKQLHARDGNQAAIALSVICQGAIFSMKQDEILPVVDRAATVKLLQVVEETFNRSAQESGLQGSALMLFHSSIEPLLSRLAEELVAAGRNPEAIAVLARLSSIRTCSEALCKLPPLPRITP